jgi:hypothetical protein
MGSLEQILCDGDRLESSQIEIEAKSNARTGLLHPPNPTYAVWPVDFGSGDDVLREVAARQICVHSFVDPSI